MSHKSFFIFFVVFLTIALAHILRLLFAWSVSINGVQVPFGVSSFAAIFFLMLAHRAVSLFIAANKDKK